MEGACAMDVTPLKRYTEPHYPSQCTLAEHPELLRLVPRRWQCNRLVLAALGMTTSMALAGCARPATATSDQSTDQPNPIRAAADSRPEYLGKVAVPWRMLTEDEARAVILDEFAGTGVRFQPDARTLRAVHVPVIDGAHISMTLDSPTDRSLRERQIELSRRLAGAVGPRAWGTPPVGLPGAIATRLVERLSGGPMTQSTEVAAIADEAIAAAKAVDGTKRKDGWIIHALTGEPEGTAPYAFPGGTWLARTTDITLDGASDDPAVAFEYLLGPRGVTTNVQSPKELSRDPDGIELGPCQDVPESLRLALDLAEPGVRHAVFHDPGRASLESAQDALRVQVREFIEWLRAEGVL